MIVEHGNLRLILKAGPIGKFQRHVLLIVQNRDLDGRLGGGHTSILHKLTINVWRHNIIQSLILEVIDETH